jgi:ATP-binding cassette subfamily B (MDR/TAP) protein 1
MFLPANEMTFIVGGSGSGKSTIAQMLLKMYAPSGGQITLDGASLQSYDEEHVRRHVACIGQDCILFDASVHDNVALGAYGRGEAKEGEEEGQVSREDVEEACRAALMHLFVKDLPDGYVLGVGGAAMSGWQRQRLAIARAKLRDPDVLILGVFFFLRSAIVFFFADGRMHQTKRRVRWTRRLAYSCLKRSNDGARTRRRS